MISIEIYHSHDSRRWIIFSMPEGTVWKNIKCKIASIHPNGMYFKHSMYQKAVEFYENSKTR